MSLSDKANEKQKKADGGEQAGGDAKPGSSAKGGSGGTGTGAGAGSAGSTGEGAESTGGGTSSADSLQDLTKVPAPDSQPFQKPEEKVKTREEEVQDVISQILTVYANPKFSEEEKRKACRALILGLGILTPQEVVFIGKKLIELDPKFAAIWLTEQLELIIERALKNGVGPR